MVEIRDDGTSVGVISPPRARLTFRVGVVGHRPNRLQFADVNNLSAVLRQVLNEVKATVHSVAQDTDSLFTKEPALVRAISPLAEGTDRIFAQEALGLGFELCCVMPFSQAEFERDFAEGKALENNSLNRFRELSNRATTRFELDGSRATEWEAYGVAGRVVLNQSDLLVVVWDGERQGKRGGTEETFKEAHRIGVPVVWIDARAPHAWQLFDAATPLPQAAFGQRLNPTVGDCAAALRKSVRDALELPKPIELAAESPHEKTEDEKEKLEAFYAERQPRWHIAVPWKAFRDIVGDGKLPQVEFKVTPFNEALKKEWPEIPQNTSPEDRVSPVARMVDWLRPFYAWPDKLAVVYADRYRSAFIVAFLLAATAVGLALLPVGAQLRPHRAPETICIAVEFTIILAILALIYRGRRKHWHERWLEYRLVAELVRHLRLVAPLGGARPFPQVPAHWATYGQPGASWMAWYVRAVERALGLPSVVVNKKHLNASLFHLSDVLRVQEKYHDINSKRCHRIEQNLHTAGITLLALTLVCCVLHLLPAIWHGFDLPTWLPPVLTFFCGFFPALGAALAGIVNQGEFRRIAKRSEAMRQQLQPLLKHIESLREQIETSSVPAIPQYSVEAAALASDAARLLVNEVLDWRVVFLDQPLKPPA